MTSSGRQLAQFQRGTVRTRLPVVKGQLARDEFIRERGGTGDCWRGRRGKIGGRRGTWRNSACRDGKIQRQRWMQGKKGIFNGRQLERDNGRGKSPRSRRVRIKMTRCRRRLVELKEG